MAACIRVLCVTPYGIEGRGGIDRLYYYLRQTHGPKALVGIELDYFAARGNAPGALWALTFPWRVILFVARLIATRPQLAHFNFAIGGSVLRKYVLLRIAKLFGAQTVIHFHGQFTATDVAGRSPWMRLLLPLCRHATRIVVLGGCYARAFTELIGVPPEKIVIIPNGIPDFAGDLALPKPAHEALRLVFLGEVGLRKGADILLDALALLHKRSRAWRCVIAGNGDVARFRAMASALGLDDHVQFMHWLDAEAVHQLVRNADVVVLPSRSEALPLTLLEGACGGAALVATSVGEIPEIVQDGVNGILIGAAAKDLADAIARLIGDRAQLARMQVASRRLYREKFQMQAFAAALSALYASLAPARTTEPQRRWRVAPKRDRWSGCLFGSVPRPRESSAETPLSRGRPDN